MVETTYRLNCPVSIALLADFHNGDPAPVLKSLQAHRPDIIAIAGDLIYGSQPDGNDLVVQKQANVLPLVRGCCEVAPTYISLGNHEWMLHADDLALLESTGAVVLDNTWVERDGLVIGGLSSAYVTDYRRFVAALPVDARAETRHPRKDSLSGVEGLRTATERVPEADWLEEYASVRGFHILLDHHPEHLPYIPQGIQLVLSGHAHGGQWRVFKHGVFAPGQSWWPRYTKGMYENRLVVSAGLSNTTWVPRINNPTEIAFIEPG